MEDSRQRSGRVLVFPFPLQGHVNPILQFSKRLVQKGFRITFFTTSSTHRSFRHLRSSTMTSAVGASMRHLNSISFVPLNDGFPEGIAQEPTHDFFRKFEDTVSRSLHDFLKQRQTANGDISEQNTTIKYIIYDSFLPWVLTVARGFRLEGAPFFTQSCAVKVVYYHFCEGKRLREGAEKVILPAMPELSGRDLPTYLYKREICPSLADLSVEQFRTFGEADRILINSFEELEKEVFEWVKTIWPVKHVGPTIPSMLLDKRLEGDTDYGLSLFNPCSTSCKEWLDSKQPGSVVYASFGSLVEFGEDQMKEIASGLTLSGYFFLLVVRESEMDKLPADVSEKGLIVNWSPQLEVLAHEAVACFATHCGWNSTLEALSLGVPMVAMPRWNEQPTNAKFISDVWKVGIRVEEDKHGFITKEELVRCLKEIMDGENGEEIRSNSRKWKKLAKESMLEGGSSHRNIEELVDKLQS